MFPANRCFHVVRRRRFFFCRVDRRLSDVCSDMLLLTVVAIVFVAALVHSTLGFGTALVAMPMLVALLDVNVATPLVGLTMLTTIALLLVRTWRDLDVRAALHLLVASIPGIPLGLLVLRYAPQDAFRAGLGILLIAIGLYNLRTSVLPRLEHIRWAHVFGFRVRFSRQRIQRERGAGGGLRDPEALAARRLQGDAAGVLLSLDPAHCLQPCVGRAVDRGRFRILSAGRACHHCRRFSG